MIDSFYHIPVLHLATVWYSRGDVLVTSLRSMSTVVQINLKQPINSALNNEQMVSSSKMDLQELAYQPQ